MIDIVLPGDKEAIDDLVRRLTSFSELPATTVLMFVEVAYALGRKAGGDETMRLTLAHLDIPVHTDGASLCTEVKP